MRLASDRRLKQDWWYLQAADHFYYMSTKHFGEGHSNFSPYETPYQAFTNYMNVLSDFLVRVDEQFPQSVDNEELNALLTTIRNQEREIETLTREKDSMSKNLEQYNIEHKYRKTETAEAEEAKTAAKPAARKAAHAKEAAKKAPAKK